MSTPSLIDSIAIATDRITGERMATARFVAQMVVPPELAEVPEKELRAFVTPGLINVLQEAVDLARQEMDR